MPLDQRYRPTELKAPHGARVLEIAWADGQRQAYPHEVLRGYCPCATCQGHAGSIAFRPGGNLELRDIEQVGNYAIGLTWGDGHSAGIYSFRFLRELGALLEQHGVEGVKALGELPRL
jgi:DUF971 family protein